MEKRILGKNLEVSAIGLGCMGMSHAYGTVSTQKEAEQLIEKALDCGLRQIIWTYIIFTVLIQPCRLKRPQVP